MSLSLSCISSSLNSFAEVRCKQNEKLSAPFNGGNARNGALTRLCGMLSDCKDSGIGRLVSSQTRCKLKDVKNKQWTKAALLIVAPLISNSHRLDRLVTPSRLTQVTESSVPKCTLSL